MNPIDPESDDRDWIAEGWRYLLERDTSENVREPDWFEHPALAQSTISTPRLRRLFETFNRGRRYEEQVKPFNFMLVAFVPVIERPADEQRMVLVAPYERDPNRWMELPWVNRFTGREYRITTTPSDGAVTPGLVCVKTYRDVFEEYLAHVEAKSAAPDGGRCRPETQGATQAPAGPHANPCPHRQGVEPARGHRGGPGRGLGEVQSEYDDYYSREFVPLVLPKLRRLGVREVARRTGHSLGVVSAALAGKSRPRPNALHRYAKAAGASCRGGAGPVQG